jgi:hypothetical protein
MSVVAEILFEVDFFNPGIRVSFHKNGDGEVQSYAVVAGIESSVENLPLLSIAIYIPSALLSCAEDVWMIEVSSVVFVLTPHPVSTKIANPDIAIYFQFCIICHHPF